MRPDVSDGSFTSFGCPGRIPGLITGVADDDPSGIAAAIDANLAIRVGNVRAIAHQTARFRKFTSRVDRGDTVVGCQLGQLNAS